MQEAFVDALRGIASFRGEARLSTWLYRITVRAAMRVTAAARKRCPTISRGAPRSHTKPSRSRKAPHASWPHSGACRRRSAAVLALAALENMPQTEIAAVLGIPAGTVCSRLHETRARLRAELTVS